MKGNFSNTTFTCWQHFENSMLKRDLPTFIFNDFFSN